MTELEFEKQENRILKYKNAIDKIAAIENKKAKIKNGILSIKCAYDKDIDFEYLGNEFKERLIQNIVSFFDSEIENIKKSMEEI